MRRAQLHELHYLTPIKNVLSILERGILSHVRAEALPHRSIAMAEIQDRRASVVIPGTGKKLHEYANLYICGRNPMLFKRRREEICVLAVSADALDLPGAIVTDQNAATNWVSFRSGASGLSHVSMERTFAEDWRDDSPIEYWRKKAAKCAEVLVPDQVDAGYILRAYVGDEQAKLLFEQLQTSLTVTIDEHLFFR